MTAYVPPGSLLLAWPGMRDPRFAKSVILVCHHDGRGAYGLVLNRPQSRRVADLVEPGHLLEGLPHPVFLGGPVDLARLQFVHALPAAVPGGLRVGADLWLGGDVEALVRTLRRAPDCEALPVRFFLGYSGWDTGQLDRELAGASWMVIEGSARTVLASDGPSAWSDLLEERARVRALGPWAEDRHGN